MGLLGNNSRRAGRYLLRIGSVAHRLRCNSGPCRAMFHRENEASNMATKRPTGMRRGVGCSSPCLPACLPAQPARSLNASSVEGLWASKGPTDTKHARRGLAWATRASGRRKVSVGRAVACRIAVAPVGPRGDGRWSSRVINLTCLSPVAPVMSAVAGAGNGAGQGEGEGDGPRGAAGWDPMRSCVACVCHDPSTCASTPADRSRRCPS